MTVIFWISLTWVLACTAISRLPVQQRHLPGAVLMLAAVPILLLIWMQISFWLALLGLCAVVSTFPNVVRLAKARYRGEDVKIDANVLRYLVVPGEL